LTRKKSLVTIKVIINETYMKGCRYEFQKHTCTLENSIQHKNCFMVCRISKKSTTLIIQNSTKSDKIKLINHYG
jgi:hypothetical protein